MKFLINLFPTLAVTGFLSLGHSTHFYPVIMGPLGALLIIPLAVALLWPGRGHSATPIDWGLSVYVVGAGLALWIWPEAVKPLMKAGAEALLYLVLLLVAAVPPLVGLRPFTEYYARRQQPKEVWQTGIFKNINLRMTWVWAVVFSLALASAVVPAAAAADPIHPIWLIFRLAIPLTLMLGFGGWFNRWYPRFYMQKLGSAQAAAPTPPGGSGGPKEDSMTSVQDINSAKELIAGMPMAFNAAAAGDLKAVIQFEVSGDEEFTAHLSIADGACTHSDGPAESPDLVVKTPADVWLGIAKGQINGQAAFMGGQFTAQGNMGLLLQMNSLFPGG